MADDVRDWRVLCRLASEEQDGDRLWEITAELLHALDEDGNDTRRSKIARAAL